jgi:calcineurin-like phosphoesterase
MCGAFDSVIGMDKEVSLKRMTLGTSHKYQSATGDLKVNGVHIEIDSHTGQAMKIQTICEPRFIRSFGDMMNI